MDYSIPQINKLQGTRQVPGDKSISHRAIMIGAIADGDSEIISCSRAADPMSSLSCIKQLGVSVEDRDSTLIIHGKGRNGLDRPASPLDAANSGTTMRLISGILVGQKFPSVLVGDPSLSQRPMKRIIEPLRSMGAKIRGNENNTAPLTIEPTEHLKSIKYEMTVQSAQVKSAILFAGLFADGTTTVTEKVGTRDHTERMLGLETRTTENGNLISVDRNTRIEGKKFFVPGDISAAAFLVAAAMIYPGADLRILNVGLNPTRKRIIEIFKSMGGNIRVENNRIIEGEPVGDLAVSYSELRNSIELNSNDIVDIIDEIPILSVVAMFAEGIFSIRGAKELRAKETDRISAIVNNMRLLGCEVEEYEDGFSFESKKHYSGKILPSYRDHRIAMAFGVAGLRISGIKLTEAECVDISFPDFWNVLLNENK